MCSIITVNGKHTQDEINMMLKIMAHRGPDGFGIYAQDMLKYNSTDFNCSDFSMAHNLLSIVGICEFQPFRSGKLTLVANAEIYNYKELIEKFNLKNINSMSDCEIILKLIEYYYSGDLKSAVLKTVEHLDGDYAFCVYDSEDYVVVRDNVGVKPVYYASNLQRFMVASEQKALKAVGMNDIKNLNPRYMIHNDKIVKFRDDYMHLDFYTNYNQAKDDLKEALINSVSKRVADLDSVAVLFSGGVDSTIIVQILKNLGVDVNLYSVGVKNCQDLEVAEKVASKLHLPLKTMILDEEVIANSFEATINTIESTNLMKIGVGMTIKLTSQLAHEDSYKVILSGQGADELFAGYNRYTKKYNTPDALYEELKHDLNYIYDVNLERDDKATMSNSVELRVPYLDKQVINVAQKIPIDYLLHSADDKIRKHILRDTALDLGVPPEIANRPKKAAQYATGIDKTIKRKLLKKDKYQNLLNNLKQI